MNENTSVSRQVLLQDIGLILFMFSMLAGCLITVIASKAYLTQNVIMLFGVFLTGFLASLRAKTASTIAAAVEILIFAVYKIYSYAAYHQAIELSAFLWPVLILASAFGMDLFISLFSNMEGINSILNRRIDELTVIDPLTGLENYRSLIQSLARYMALCERNGTDMGLMLVRLRYADELRKVLTARQFNELRYQLADTIQDTLRLEDRIFSTDEKGSIAIIYFSLPNGVDVIKRRIYDAVAKKNMLPDLNEQMLTVELSIVSRHYDKSLKKDSVRFITETEREFAYEV